MTKPALGHAGDDSYFSAAGTQVARSVGGLSRMECLELIEQILERRIDGLNTLERRDLKALLTALRERIPGASVVSQTDQPTQ